MKYEGIIDWKGVTASFVASILFSILTYFIVNNIFSNTAFIWYLILLSIFNFLLIVIALVLSKNDNRLKITVKSSLVVIIVLIIFIFFLKNFTFNEPIFGNLIIKGSHYTDYALEVKKQYNFFDDRLIYNKIVVEDKLNNAVWVDQTFFENIFLFLVIALLSTFSFALTLIIKSWKDILSNGKLPSNQ